MKSLPLRRCVKAVTAHAGGLVAGFVLVLATPAVWAGVAPPAALPFPHPLITEVLYAVPVENGDANGDGARQVAGDEFVELSNPHAQAIDLRGYKLFDRGSASSGAARAAEPLFTFPACRVEPGQVVVVFNGHASNIPAPVGDARGAPAAGNAKFGGALVFSMRAPSQRVAFSNTADHCLLVAPDGIAVQLVHWGADSAKPVSAAPPLLSEAAPVTSKGSVERRTVDGPWLEVRATESRAGYTPGLVAWAKPPADAPQPTVPRLPPVGPGPGPGNPELPSSPAPMVPKVPPVPSTPGEAPANPAAPAPGPGAEAEAQPTQLAIENRTGRTIVLDLGVLYRVGGMAEGSSVPRLVPADQTVVHTFPGGGPSPRPYVRVALAEPAEPGKPTAAAVMRLLAPGKQVKLVAKLAPKEADGSGGGVVLETP